MKKQVAKWSAGARVGKLEPDVALSEFDRIRKTHGTLTPATVLKEARKKRNPLHQYFEWNDSIAAAKYRQEQARYMIRHLKVTVIDPKNKDQSINVRKYVSIGDGIGDGKESQFHDVNMVVNDSDLRDRMVRKLWNRLLSMKQEYEHFVEFADIWQAVDRTAEKLKQVAQ